MEPVGNLLNGYHPSVTTDSSVSSHPSVSSELDLHKATVCTGRVYRHEDILAQDSAQVRGLRPDAIISWGLQIVGKRTRNWLRQQSETNERNPIGSRRPRHFRLDPLGWAVDPYHNPPELIRLTPYNALHAVTNVMNCERIGGQETQGLQQYTPTAPTKSQGAPVSNESYQKQWQLQEQKAENMLAPLLKYLPFGDLAVIKEVGRHIGADHAVHLGNSMPIRYWQMLGGGARSWWLHANRGTSGIDGVNSTALGFALSMPERTVWLVTGDLSFAYDMRNVLAHGYYKVDLTVVWKTIERDLPYLQEQVSIALKDIQIGEELSFDYAMTDTSQYDEFVCEGNESNCRQKITGSDWQNKE
jgi:2-succinyl-5-enolpyruvyl-6-hydroxy-3-cyclohexene-1-carboxylate synthase